MSQGESLTTCHLELMISLAITLTFYLAKLTQPQSVISATQYTSVVNLNQRNLPDTETCQTSFRVLFEYISKRYKDLAWSIVY